MAIHEDYNGILTTPLIELDVDPAFVAQSLKMGFKSISTILKIKPEMLIAMNGFSYGWLSQLSALLIRHKALHLLQTIPGNSLY